MEVRRGFIVRAAGPGEYSRKPRPFLIVQADEFNQTHASICLCPITSEVTGQYLFRIPLQPNAENGLTETSEVQVDKVQSLRRERIRSQIGQVEEAIMAQVDEALRRWLSL